MSQEWPIRLYEQVILCDNDNHHPSENDSQMVPMNEMNILSDHASMATNEENPAMDVSIPLDARFHCQVELTRCNIESVADTVSEVNKDQEEDMFAETKDTDKEEEEDLTWLCQEYLDIFSAAYPTSQQEEEEFNTAYYDENGFDPAIFLDTNTLWFPR